MASTTPDFGLLVCLGPSTEPLAGARIAHKWWPEPYYVFCPRIFSILKCANIVWDLMHPLLLNGNLHQTVNNCSPSHEQTPSETSAE